MNRLYSIKRIITEKAAEFERYAPLVVICIVVSVIIILPLKIIGSGYLPGDDALRYAAKVISGKDWNQILVLRNEIKMDDHPGWLTFLTVVHKITNLNQEGLVIFSVIFCFLIFCFIPLLFLEYPEIWLLVLIFISVLDPLAIQRLFFGRVYVINMCCLLVICFLWERLKAKKFPAAEFIILTISLAISQYLHGSWYLFVLPVLAFCIARQWKGALRLAIATIAGVFLGALLTGHPVVMLRQSAMIAHWVSSAGNVTSRFLVTEFQPFYGETLMILAVCLLLMFRYIRSGWNLSAVYNPVFVLVVLGWILGFSALRFWTDWGIPALMVWAAVEFQGFYKQSVNALPWRRVWVAMLLSVAALLIITSDFNSRWTENLTKVYLSQEDPAQTEWLPGEGGIIYSNDTGVFFDTFFKNPKASWRYIIGFSNFYWMPAEDAAIYLNIIRTKEFSAYEPWIRKMRPEDRLIITLPKGTLFPIIPALEWYRVGDMWIGRLPKSQIKI